MSTKKIIVTESVARRIISENAVDDVIKSRDFEKKVKDVAKDSFKNDKELDKELEKKVRKIVAKSVNTLFRTLWQRSNFYEDSIKNGLY